MVEQTGKFNYGSRSRDSVVECQLPQLLIRELLTAQTKLARLFEDQTDQIKNTITSLQKVQKESKTDQSCSEVNVFSLATS